MSIDDIMIRLIEELLPSAAQFVMVLIALVGSIIVLRAFMDLYKMLSEDMNRTPDGATVSGSLVRVLIGGLMVVPSAVLWRSADMLLGGGTATETAVLSYIGGVTPTATCDRFAGAIQLMFLVVGLIALYNAFQNWNDQARGFNSNGVRTAIPYAIGGLGCIFIIDIFAIIGTAFGVNAGLTQLCGAFG